MLLGRYQVLAEVGRGGTAVVYRGRAPDGRDVAIKLFQGEARDELQRFVREQKVHAMFGPREGYVPFVDAGDGPSGPFIVMPFMRGGTLRDRLEEGALEPRAAAALGVALATALGRAHEKGIVHRDLKPENVLYSADGRPFIGDLGLARHFRHDVPLGLVTVTQSGEVHGTLGYVAPEQLSNSSRVGPPADVFALGAILYECLAGRPAFAGASSPQTFLDLVNKGAEPLGAVRPDLPVNLGVYVERALRVDPEERFSDGSSFARVLGTVFGPGA